MSRASRSDTPDRGLRAPRSPLSVSCTSTPPQAPPADEATPPAPASGDAEHCCVCLERLLPAAHGAQLRVPFPACSRHSMHLECLAQYRAQANGPPDLLCPLCRHSRCPECAHGGWSGVHDEHLRSLCRREGVPMPERISGEVTVRQAVQDYQLRTFTSNDAPEPRAPPGVTVLCCLGPRGRGRIRSIAARAPVPIRSDTGIAAWRPGWLCPGCATEVPLDALQILAHAGGACNRCGGELHWIFDRVAAGSSWSCTAGCAGPAAPPHAAAPPPEAPHAAEALPHDAPAATSPGASRPAAAFWLTRGPPLGVVADSTNSWLYVPLLHAAAADLAPIPHSKPGEQTQGQQTGGSRLASSSRPPRLSPRRPLLLLSPALPKLPLHTRTMCLISLRASTRRACPMALLCMPAGRCGSCVSRMVTFLRRCRKFFSNVSVAMPSRRRSTVTLTASVQTPNRFRQLRRLRNSLANHPLPRNSPDRRPYRLPPPCRPIMPIPRSATSTQMRQSWHQRRRTLSEMRTPS